MSKTAMIRDVSGGISQALPEKVAKRILTAYDEGHTGQLDLI